jgi:DNA-binding transcriptional ArsR family regulator
MLEPALLEAAARFFRAAGDAARLNTLVQLRRGELCVSELAAAASDEMSTVSQRLRLLHAEGFLRKRREGKHILYRLADEHVRELLDTVLSHVQEHPFGTRADAAGG